ncbi:MAG: nucleotidyltransferase domain-containing protein [Thermodesulfobacteriota bacterium]|nr:nucleotidyltransferase domain-containing protein [Thermodesulfobacteriota bacterium]
MDKKQAPQAVAEYARFIRKTTPSVRHICLFGSYAKGTYIKNSDIDLAIIFDRLPDPFDMQVELK